MAADTCFDTGDTSECFLTSAHSLFELFQVRIVYSPVYRYRTMAFCLQQHNRCVNIELYRVDNIISKKKNQLKKKHNIVQREKKAEFPSATKVGRSLVRVRSGQ